MIKVEKPSLHDLHEIYEIEKSVFKNCWSEISLKKELEKIKNPKIIIDDGSHHPIHQMIFLHLSTSEILKRKNNEKKLIILEPEDESHPKNLKALEEILILNKKFNELNE